MSFFTTIYDRARGLLGVGRSDTTAEAAEAAAERSLRNLDPDYDLVPVERPPDPGAGPGVLLGGVTVGQPAEARAAVSESGYFVAMLDDPAEETIEAFDLELTRHCLNHPHVGAKDGWYNSRDGSAPAVLCLSTFPVPTSWPGVSESRPATAEEAETISAVMSDPEKFGCWRTAEEMA